MIAKTIVFVGDSTTSPLYNARWCVSGWFGRSNAQGITAGNGTLTIYANGTATWAAPDDAAGAAVSVGTGLVYLESDSADMGFCFNITQTMVNAASETGTPVNIEVIPSPWVGYGSDCPAAWGQILTGHKLEVLGCFGIDGETTAGLLERAENALLVDNLGKPTNRIPDAVHVLIGANDISYLANDLSPTYTIEDTLNNLTALRDLYVDECWFVSFGTVVFETPSPAEFALIQKVNAHIRKLMSENPRCLTSDYANRLRDPLRDDGYAIAGTMDGKHYTSVGARIAGEELAKAINIFTGTTDKGRSRFQFAGDVDNCVVNGALIGDSANVWEELTGESALEAVFTSTTGSAVGSKLNEEGELPLQIYTITNASTGDELAMFTIASCDVGDFVDGEIEIEVTGDGIISASIVLACTDEDTKNEHVFSSYSLGTEVIKNFTGVLKFPVTDVPTYSVTEKYILFVKFGAGDTVVKCRAAGAKAN